MASADIGDIILSLLSSAVGLLARLLRHAGLGDLLLELGDLVAALVHLAELFLNGLHLLIQVVLALALLHLRLDAAADALLDLQHVHLAFDGDQDVLEALAHVEDLENLLLLGQLERHVRGDGVRQAARLLDAGERGQHLGRHLLVELHVLLELRDDRARRARPSRVSSYASTSGMQRRRRRSSARRRAAARCARDRRLRPAP